MLTNDERYFKYRRENLTVESMNCSWLHIVQLLLVNVQPRFRLPMRWIMPCESEVPFSCLKYWRVPFAVVEWLHWFLYAYYKYSDGSRILPNILPVAQECLLFCWSQNFSHFPLQPIPVVFPSFCRKTAGEVLATRLSRGIFYPRHYGPFAVLLSFLFWIFWT